VKPAILRPIAGLSLLALAACGGGSADSSKTEQAAAEPEAPSSEWVQPNPTEPAVPVELPDTPMTPVPASPAAP